MASGDNGAADPLGGSAVACRTNIAMGDLSDSDVVQVALHAMDELRERGLEINRMRTTAAEHPDVAYRAGIVNAFFDAMRDSYSRPPTGEVVFDFTRQPRIVDANTGEAIP